MGKTNIRKNKKHNNKTVGQNVMLPESFDYNKFAEALVEAQFKAKEKEKELDRKRQDEDQKEWYEIIGYKEKPEKADFLRSKCIDFINYFSVMWHIISFKEKNVKCGVATKKLLGFSLKVIYVFLEVILYFFGAAFLASSLYSVEEKIFKFNIFTSIVAFFTFLIARIIRIARLEIDNMKQEYIIGLLSAITSLIAMIIAVVAIVLSEG